MNTVLANEEPIARMNITPSIGDAPLSVTLDANASIDADGQIIDYIWLSSDQQKTEGQTASMTFQQEGLYAVDLIVTDNKGAKNNAISHITVGKSQCAGHTTLNLQTLSLHLPFISVALISGADTFAVYEADIKYNVDTDTLSILRAAEISSPFSINELSAKTLSNICFANFTLSTGVLEIPRISVPVVAAVSKEIVGLQTISCQLQLNEDSVFNLVSCQNVEKDKQAVLLASPAIGLGIDFGELFINNTGTLKINIKNEGESDLSIENIRITGNNDNYFKIISANNFNILPNGNNDIELSCTPSQTGRFLATLTFNSNDEKQPEVNYTLACQGTETPKPIFNANISDNINFGDIKLGDTSSQSFVLSNFGKEDLLISNMQIIGQDKAVFSLLSQGDIKIQNTASQTFSIMCKPTVVGQFIAEVQFNSNDMPKYGTVSYILNCNGFEEISVFDSIPQAGNTLQFVDTTVTTTSTQILNIINNGKADLIISQMQISGVDSSIFSLSNQSDLRLLGGENAKKILNITCLPTDVRQFQATLNFTSNDASHANVEYPLSCNGTQADTVDIVDNGVVINNLSECNTLNTTFNEDTYNIIGSIGNGYDSDRNILKPSACLNGEASLISTGTATVSASQVTDIHDMFKRFSSSTSSTVNVDVKVSYFGLFSTETQYSQKDIETFSSSVQETELSQSFVYSFSVDNARSTFKLDTTQPLNELGLKLENNVCQFKKTCGDKFIYQTEQGVSLYAALSFNFSSKENKSRFSSSSSQNFRGSASLLGLGSVSGNWSSITNSLSSSYLLDKNNQITINVLQVGGDSTALAKILAGSDLNCSLDKINLCKATIDKIIAYSGSDAFIAGAKTYPTITNYIYSDYEQVGVFVKGLHTEVSTGIKNVRQQLATRYEQLLKDQKRAADMLATIISPQHKQELASLKAILDGDLIKIRNLGLNCFSDLANCETQATMAFNALVSYDESIFNTRLEDGLIAYYPLDNSTQDASGQNQHITTFDAPTSIKDRFNVVNKAYYFNENNQAYLDSFNVDLLSSPSMTLAGWVMLENSDGGDLLCIKDPFLYNDYMGYSYRNNYIGLFVENLNDQTEVKLLTYNESKQELPITSLLALNEKWMFVASVLDAENQSAKLYIDGQLKTTGAFETLNFSSANLSLGGCNSSFKGALDDIRIYNRPLSGTEIGELMLIDDLANNGT